MNGVKNLKNCSGSLKTVIAPKLLGGSFKTEYKSNHATSPRRKVAGNLAINS